MGSPQGWPHFFELIMTSVIRTEYRQIRLRDWQYRDCEKNHETD